MYDLNGPLGEADSILKQPYSSTTPIFISWNIIPTKAPVELMRVEKFGVCMRLMRVDGILCAHSQSSHQNLNQFKVDESRQELRDKREGELQLSGCLIISCLKVWNTVIA